MKILLGISHPSLQSPLWDPLHVAGLRGDVNCTPAERAGISPFPKFHVSSLFAVIARVVPEPSVAGHIQGRMH